MKRVNTLVPGLCLLLASCAKAPQSQLQGFLTGGSEKYWARVEGYPVKRYVGLAFHRNGRYRLYSRMGPERELITPQFTPAWKLTSDSTLVFGGMSYQIEYASDQVLVLNNQSQKSIEVYLKEADQQSKPVADKADHSLDL